MIRNISKRPRASSLAVIVHWVSLIGIIALGAVIGLGLVGCGGEDATTPPSTPDPTLTGTVSITGTAKVDQTLTATVSGSNGTGTVTYQWIRIDGTTETTIGTDQNTYVPVAADVGKTIKVKVTYAGFSGTLSSTATAAVLEADAELEELTGTVSITGMAMVDQTLTATVSGSNGTGTAVYQWIRIDGTTETNIGTDQNTYVPVAADAGKTIKVKVTYAGFSGAITSTATAAVLEAGSLAWTRGEMDLFHTVKAMAYGDGKFIAVGIASGLSNYKRTATSTDGVTWVEGSDLPNSFNGYDNTANNIVYGNNTFVVVGGNANIAVSADSGAIWTGVSVGSIFVGNDYRSIYDVAYGNNTFVAVGAGSKIAASTDNGATWTEVYTDDSNYWRSIMGVAFGNGIFVAVGENGVIVTSTDGATWTKVTDSPFSDKTINDVVFADGKWMAVGSQGMVATSTDGTTWTAGSGASDIFSGTKGEIFGVAFGNGKWVAVGNSWEEVDGQDRYTAQVAISDDSATWTKDSSDFYRAVDDDDVFYGGADGSKRFFLFGIYRFIYSNVQE